eukprot:257452_1
MMITLRRLCINLLKKWTHLNTRKQRRFFIFLICMALCCLWIQKQRGKIKRRNALRQTLTKSAHRHRIVFGISGNLLVYQMGVIKAIFEHHNMDNFRTKCTFEGISGGSATAGYCIATVHGCGDMDFWYMHGSSVPTKAAINRSLGMLFTTSKVIYKLGCSYYDRITKWNDGVKPDWLGNHQWIMWVTCANASTPEFLSNVYYSDYRAKDTADKVASVIQASSYIPFVLSKWFYKKIGQMKAIDGGIAQHLIGDDTIFRAKNCNGEECKVLYINCDLYSNGQTKRVLSNGNVVYYLNTCKWDTFGIKDYMIWADMSATDELYEKGYTLAKQNMNRIDAILSQFFESPNQ